jgi:hypothetical protein
LEGKKGGEDLPGEESSLGFLPGRDVESSMGVWVWRDKAVVSAAEKVEDEAVGVSAADKDLGSQQPSRAAAVGCATQPKPGPQAYTWPGIPWDTRISARNLGGK